ATKISLSAGTGSMLTLVSGVALAYRKERLTSIGSGGGHCELFEQFGRAGWKVTFPGDASDGRLFDAIQLSTSFAEKRVEIDIAGLRQTCRALKRAPTEVMLADVLTKRSGKLRDNFRKRSRRSA
ncbi:unnamed protein product, partial [Effrenium voratum]